jgi:hypothetical protein
MTEQDRQDLMAAMPPAFVELDRGCHEGSAELAAAGHAEDVGQELSAFAGRPSLCRLPRSLRCGAVRWLAQE